MKSVNIRVRKECEDFYHAHKKSFKTHGIAYSDVIRRALMNATDINFLFQLGLITREQREYILTKSMDKCMEIKRQKRKIGIENSRFF